MGDHPRSCGKDRLLCHRRRWQTGSPPLVRERLFPFSGANEGIGITPARAGKTIPLPSWRFARQDHPRSCGKDQFVERELQFALGSPPLVRERLLIYRRLRFSGRITPARAGKTTGYAAGNVPEGDHPRSCGKDLDVMDALFF